MDFQDLSINVLTDIFLKLSTIDILDLFYSLPEFYAKELIHIDDIWEKIYIKKFGNPLIKPLLWYEAFVKGIFNYTLCFGENNKGQLGLRQKRIEDILPNGLKNIRSMSLGVEHALLLTNDGKVYSFGDNRYAQLGRGKYKVKNQPEIIKKLPPIKSISAGFNHNLLLTQNGQVYGFGNNFWNQLGIKNRKYSFRTDYSYYNFYEPRLIEELENIEAISAGNEYSLVLNQDGKVYAFGRNELKRMGNVYPDNSKPIVLIEGLPKIQAVAAGHNSLFLSKTGEVYILGYPANVDKRSAGLPDWFEEGEGGPPELLTGLPPVKSISAKTNHYLLLTQDGEVYGFGDNMFGSLGLSKRRYVMTPELIPNIPLIQKIEAGDNFSLLLDYEGNVFISGMLGVDISKTTKGFQKIPSLDHIKDIAVGTGFAFFLKNYYTNFESIEKLIENDQITSYKVRYSIPEEPTLWERAKFVIFSSYIEDLEIIVIDFTDSNGYVYNVKARYDPMTEKIFPL